MKRTLSRPAHLLSRTGGVGGGLFAFLLLLLSCTSGGDTFRLQGRFRNMNQAEFYVYDQRGGGKDTIVVRDGRFEYSRLMEDSTTLMLMFPNYSELPLFAHGGITLTMKGDASHLRETRVSGDEANEEMTELRLALADQTPPEQQRIARHYIADHPASPVVLYLVQHFLLRSAQPDYPEAYRLCSLVAKAQPDNLDAALLLQQLERLKNAVTKGRVAAFTAIDDRDRRVGLAQLDADAAVVIAWASWHNESQNMLRLLRQVQRRHKGRLAVLSISLDANEEEIGRLLFERDTITWPNVRDGRMWQSTLLTHFGIGALGGNVVIDKDKRIVARNLGYNALREKLEQMLK